MTRLLRWLRARREPVMYVVCGGLTTLVDFLAYLAATRLVGAPPAAGSLIANLAATGFAYVVNKRLVFRRRAAGGRALAREALLFFLSRALSMATSTALMWLTAEVLGWPDVWMKIAVNIVVIVMNYVTSKWIVFAR